MTEGVKPESEQPPPTRLRTVGKHALVYGAGVVISRAASFVMLPIYTRYLTTADYGVLELLEMTTTVVGMLVGLGFGGALFKFYAQYDDPDEKAAVMSTAWLALLGIAGLTAVAGVIVSPVFSRALLHRHQNPLYFQLYFLVYLVQTAAIVPYAYLQATKRSKSYVMASVAQLVLALSLNIYLVVGRRMEVLGVVISTLIANAFVAAWLIGYFIRHNGVRFSFPRAKQMAAFGFPLALWSLGSFVLTFSDRYFLNYYSTTGIVGIYSLGYKFGFVLVAFAYQPFSLVWDPHRFEVAKQPNATSVFGHVFFYLTVVLVGMGILIAVYVKDFLRVMSDHSFLPAFAVVPVVLVAYVLQSWTNFCNIGIYLKERTDVAAWCSWVGVGVCIALNFLLISRYSMMGAAIATVGAFLARFILVYIFSQRLYRIAYPWWRVAALGTVAAAAVLIRFLLPDLPIVASVGVDSGLAVCAAVVIALVIVNREERASIRDVVRGRLAMLFARS